MDTFGYKQIELLLSVERERERVIPRKQGLHPPWVKKQHPFY